MVITYLLQLWASIYHSIAFTSTMLFYKKKFIKIHRHFMHRSTGKLLKLLKRAYWSKVRDKLIPILHNSADKREQCSEQSVPTFRFIASIPLDQNIFNMELSIDLMWLNGKPLLHIVENKLVTRTKSLSEKNQQKAFGHISSTAVHLFTSNYQK